MENLNDEQQKVANQIYEYATNLMIDEKKNSTETKEALISRGLDEENASAVVSNLEQQISTAKKSRANKDMLYGALWCIGGTIATVANFGYIFWGAILFGAIQFIKGVVNSQRH